MPHSVSTGNVRGLARTGLSQAEIQALEAVDNRTAHAVGADSSGRSNIDMIQRFPAPGESKNSRERIVSRKPDSSLSTVQDTSSIDKQTKRGRLMEQPIISLSFSDRKDSVGDSMGSDNRQNSKGITWIGVRLLRHTSIWDSLMKMSKRSTRVSLSQPEGVYGNKFCTLLLAFASDGGVYAIRPKFPGASVDDCQCEPFFITRLPVAWIPNMYESLPLPYVFISHEMVKIPKGDAALASPLVSTVEMPTLTFVGIPNQTPDQLEWLRFRLLPTRGRAFGTWEPISLTSSLRLRQVWGTRQQMTSSVNSTIDPAGLTTAPSDSQDEKYITWTSAEVNGRFFLVCSRFDGRLISFCLNPSRTNAQPLSSLSLCSPLPQLPLHGPTNFPPDNLAPVADDRRTFDAFSEQPSTTCHSAQNSLETLNSHGSILNGEEEYGRQRRGRYESLGSDGDDRRDGVDDRHRYIHRRLRLRRRLRASAKMCLTVTENNVFSCNASLSDERRDHSITNQVSDSSTRTVRGMSGVERTIDLSKGRRHPEINVVPSQRDESNARHSDVKGSDLRKEKISDPRRLITSLLSVGRDVIVGGSSLGDLFWWALPRLVLRGSIPGLHSAPIAGLHRIINFGVDSYAFDTTRVLSVDASGHITIIDTSLSSSIFKDESRRFQKKASSSQVSPPVPSDTPSHASPPCPLSEPHTSPTRSELHTSYSRSNSGLSSRERSPGHQMRHLRKRHGFVDALPLPRKMKNDNVEKNGPRRNSRLEVPSIRPECESSSVGKDFPHPETATSVDSGGWAVNWSPELAKRRQRGLASSILYSDSLDLCKS